MAIKIIKRSGVTQIVETPDAKGVAAPTPPAREQSHPKAHEKELKPTAGAAEAYIRNVRWKGDMDFDEKSEAWLLSFMGLGPHNATNRLIWDNKVPKDMPPFVPWFVRPNRIYGKLLPPDTLVNMAQRAASDDTEAMPGYASLTFPKTNTVFEFTAKTMFGALACCLVSASQAGLLNDITGFEHETQK